MYVALKRVRFEDRYLEPGDEVPGDEGRNTNLMLRQGLIADLDVQQASEASAAQAMEGAKARISNLEGLLADANAELASLRAQEEPSPSEGDGAAAHTPQTLAPLNRAALDEVAGGHGIDTAAMPRKRDVIDAILAAQEEPSPSEEETPESSGE